MVWITEVGRNGSEVERQSMVVVSRWRGRGRPDTAVDCLLAGHRLAPWRRRATASRWIRRTRRPYRTNNNNISKYTTYITIIRLL